MESTLLTVTEVFVYKVPPLKSAAGQRAEDWNLANPLLTGGLRVYQNDTVLRIAVFSYKDPVVQSLTEESASLFCECIVEVQPGSTVLHAVDSVIDSSRYFVLRIKDKASSKTALIGIGFRERDTAFDFKNVLNDFVRYLDRAAMAEKLKSLWSERENGTSSADDGAEGTSEANPRDGAGEDDPDDGGPGGSGYGAVSASSSSSSSRGALTLAQHRDLALKPGQKITIKSKALSAEKDKPKAASPPPKPVALPPPPPPGARVGLGTLSPPPAAVSGTPAAAAGSTVPAVPAVTTPRKDVEPNGNGNDDDDEWGEFGAAPVQPTA